MPRCKHVPDAREQWRSLSRHERARVVLDIWGPLFRDAMRSHRRAALLEAYRRRRQWRAADLKPLLELGVNIPAQRRIARNLSPGKEKRGRGVLKKHRPLAIVMLDFFLLIQQLFDPNTPASERRRLLERTAWWPQFVEACYRGELTAAQAERARAGMPEYGREEPSETAEEAVAAAAGITAVMVHRLCQKARERQRRGGTAPDEPMRAADLRALLETGDIP
jgi:hypothetical protein